MKVSITISRIYCNASLRNFFFRTQAENTFEELCERANDLNELFNEIDDLFDDLDEFEEMLYNDDLSEIIDYIGEEYFEDEEDNEE